MKVYLLQLTHFDYWANARILQQLRAITSKHNDADFEKAVSVLHHIVNVQANWLKRIEDCLNQKNNFPRLVPGLWETHNITREQLYLEENKDNFVALLESVQDLSIPVSYSNSTGVVFTNTLADLLLHLSHHGHYHRGQINLLLRKMGGEPPLIDYIYYIRQLHEV